MWYGSTRDNIRLVKTDIFITEKCNLKCANCSSLMQYFENPVNVKLIDISEGLKKLYSLVDFSGFTAVLGGEPTLHPEFNKILQEVAKYKTQMSELTVTSNGIKPPNDSVVDALKEHGIKYNISMYPTFEECQIRTADYLKSKDVNVEVFDPCWTDRTQRRENNGNIFYVHCKHMVAPCVTMRGTELWYCEFANNANALGSKSDYIDLTQSITKEQVYNYLNPQEPFNACKYCSGAYSDIKIDNGAAQCKTCLRWNV